MQTITLIYKNRPQQSKLDLAVIHIGDIVFQVFYVFIPIEIIDTAKNNIKHILQGNM